MGASDTMLDNGSHGWNKSIQYKKYFAINASTLQVNVKPLNEMSYVLFMPIIKKV